jgi:transcriptional regulator with XRE-family HTH domain
MSTTPANWFRSRRDTLGLTRRALAERVGVTERAVANWETGSAVPRRGLWLTLTRVYRVRLGELRAAMDSIATSPQRAA